jgi:murein DD-endopeptidase MepM/ murein hydrolase activator NlpD
MRRWLPSLGLALAGCYQGVALPPGAAETGDHTQASTGTSEGDSPESDESDESPETDDPPDPADLPEPGDPADPPEIPPPVVSCGDDHPYSMYEGAHFPPPAQIFSWPLPNEQASNDRSEPNHLISPFGPRWKSNDLLLDAYDFHEGLDLVPLALRDVVIDLDNPEHRFPVYPAIAGRVHAIETCDPCEPGGPGNHVVIRHMIDGSDPPQSGGAEGQIYYTRYLHLDSIAPGLAVGHLVDVGDQLGIMGESGANGPHLHFEVRSYDYLFYAVNPYRYLSRSGDGYPPPFEIAFRLDPGGLECGDLLVPAPSRFWVSFAAPRGDEDIVKIEASVTDRETCETAEWKAVNFDCRQGITTWSDTNGDQRIRTDEDLYLINDRMSASYPVFEKCGQLGEPRNHFTRQSSEYTLDIEFCDAPLGLVGLCGLLPPLTGVSEDFRIDARVCDATGKCRMLSRMAEGAQGCACDSDCLALQCSGEQGFDEPDCHAYLKTEVPGVCTTQDVVSDQPSCPAARCVDNTCVP